MKNPSTFSFSELGLSEILLRNLAKLGYETPTQIQREAIPILREGRDALGEAATGTGKTAAFVLPLLERLQPFEPHKPPRALILVPTRELAMQVRTAVARYAAGMRVHAVAVYGGASIAGQIAELKRGAHLVIATPGRAADLLERGALKLHAIEALVLDEADEMMEMGFQDDLDKLLAAAPTERQTALFSATLPRHIALLAKRHLRDPRHIRVDSGRPKGLVEQFAVVCREPLKLAALERVIMTEKPSSALVFCRTREDVDEVCSALNRDGFDADALHGGHSQAQRDAVMHRFRVGETHLLVATDVAARGLDVAGLSHVFNFDLPESPEVYVHRIGRTGRAGKQGRAISFAGPHQLAWLRRYERQASARIMPLPVPKAAEIRRLQMESLAAELTPRFGEVDPEMVEQVLAWADDQPTEIVAAALLEALMRQLFGKAGALLEKHPDAAFLPPRRDERPRQGHGGQGPHPHRGRSAPPKAKTHPKRR